MHWTADAIRRKADDMERRLGRIVRVGPDTLELLVTALRFYAREGMADRHASYNLDVWDRTGNAIVEHLGALSNFAAAQAAFEAACAARPDAFITLRQGARVVRKSAAASQVDDAGAPPSP